MCGIFGYVGSRSAEPILIEALRTLEYRGYDSAGIFVGGHGAVKAVGPIDSLAAEIQQPISGNSGIAHTRWATHGSPTVANAHPHTDNKEKIWLVHNGIIENYREIKDSLIESGVVFKSETDTEVLAALIGSLYESDLQFALNEALKQVRGTYGLALMSADDPDQILVARMGSPIVLGVGDEGHFVSSDPSALLAHTKKVIYLNDGEVAVVTKDGHSVITKAGEETKRPPETIEWDQEEVQKQGYEHFMLKEIFEAPEVIENTIRGRLIESEGRAKLGGFEEVLDNLVNLNRVSITACGSAYLAGQVGKYILEEYAHLPVDIELASEYRYKTNIPDKNSALLAVSQSGETADTLAAVRLAKELGVPAYGMVNVVGSTIARETDAGMYNHAGPEVAVASTKVVISQLVSFVLLTLLIGREKGMTESEGKEIVEGLKDLPKIIGKMLEDTKEIQECAYKYKDYQNVMFIGRKFHAPIAYEGSMKLKEVTYIHAEAYAGGELKHGSIALLDERFPVIALAPKDDVYDKMVSNIEEVKARNAPVLVVTTEGATEMAEIADDVIYVPKVHPILQPIVSTMPLHLFTYYVGIAKGLNVDRPRNLAKSVTVE